MQSIFVRFLSENDRVRGFYELARRSRVTSFPGQVYQVPIEALPMLEDQAYRLPPGHG
ncbi:MAG: hypothetical protein KY475_02985 [Planctomycetes bacterium]|nr:hypothetical protein [Planctomycetota bacterium]